MQQHGANTWEKVHPSVSIWKHWSCCSSTSIPAQSSKFRLSAQEIQQTTKMWAAIQDLEKLGVKTNGKTKK